MTASLAQIGLADPAYVGAFYLQVTVGLFIDTGRPGQPLYTVSVLSPRPVFSCDWSNHDYDVVTGVGHDLNATGGRLDVTLKSRTTVPALNVITYLLLPDGLSFLADSGFPYVVAVRGSGPDIYRSILDPDTGAEEPNNRTLTGLRPDIHLGNEADSTGFPTTDRWLRNRVDSVDVSLIPVPVVATGELHVRPGTRRTHFRYA